MVSRSTPIGKRIVWIDSILAEELDAMGEKEGISENKNRYADMARIVLNRAVQAAEGAQ